MNLNLDWIQEPASSDIEKFKNAMGNQEDIRVVKRREIWLTWQSTSVEPGQDKIAHNEQIEESKM
jgi:hypothetical protein